MMLHPHPKHAPLRALRTTRSAFTLLEVLVVVAIIVMLAGVGSYFLLQRYEEAKISRAKMDLSRLTSHAETYKVNNDGMVPPSIDALVQPQPNGGAPLAAPNEVRDPWGKPYMLDPSGQNNGGFKPDIYTTTPQGVVVGNWMK